MHDNPIDYDLMRKLSRLQWLMQRQHMRQHAQRGPMASPVRGQGRVLAMLKIQPEISTRDLSYLLGIRQQSLNELLHKLEKSEYITREPSEEDRRVMIVKLTEKGKDAQLEAEKPYDAFACLTEEERKTFCEYLDRIIAALEETLGDDAAEPGEDWMRAARSRMGDEQFDRLMAMRRGGPPHHRGPHDFHGRHGCGKHGDAPPPPPPPEEWPEECEW